MDLIFTIAGLLMTWSLANYLKRERRLITRVAQQKPKQIYSFEVPYCKKLALNELKHFVKSNHLAGTYLKKKKQSSLETWLLQTEENPNLRFPIYIDQVSERRTIIEIGAASLNAEPYILFKGKHKKAAIALGSHFERTWERKKYVEKLAARL